MPKKKIKLKLVAYEKDNSLFAEIPLSAYSYSKIFKVYMEYVELLIQGKYTDICRLDLVSSSRVLFSCNSLRHVMNQKNYTIIFNPY